MTLYIALLRGINVGGHKQIKMADLKLLCEEIGLANVQTYIQSGNVIFEHPDQTAEALRQQLMQAIEGRYGFGVEVALRTLAEWEDVLARNPFPDQAAAQPTQVMASLFTTLLETLPAIDQQLWPVKSEQFKIELDAVYLYCPDGYGTTKLSNEFWEKQLKIKTTTRNWNTMLKLTELAHQRAT